MASTGHFDMKILYVRREDKESYAKRKLKDLRRTLYFNDQDGYFEQSLHSVGEVTEIFLNELPAFISGKHTFDALVVNSKCGGSLSQEEKNSLLWSSLSSLSVPKALFIGAAQAQWMVHNQEADLYDVIFKREPYRDRSRYLLSDNNRKKIVPTMIYCPFMPQPRNNSVSRMYHQLRPRVARCNESEQLYDVCFSGSLIKNNTTRLEVWQSVVESGFSTIGGLQYHSLHKIEPPIELQAPRLKGEEYRKAICSAKINLALEGIGEFTFRHLELWYLGVFMISSPSIREIELPINVREGEHFVTFDNLEDLIEKISFYLLHEKERIRIAHAGQDLFNKEYDPIRHGAEIREALCS